MKQSTLERSGCSSKIKNLRKFFLKAGQFGEYSMFGEGESTFCIASSPTRSEYIECSFKQIEKVTSSMRRLMLVIQLASAIRKLFSVEEMKGKNVLFIAGGIGLALPLCHLECSGFAK